MSFMGLFIYLILLCMTVRELLYIVSNIKTPFYLWSRGKKY